MVFFQSVSLNEKGKFKCD